MTNQKYKNLTLREFDAAAEKFDDSDPSVYNLCRKDYPDLLEELLKEPCQDVLDCGRSKADKRDVCRIILW